MACIITLNEDDIRAIERKLQSERNTLSQEDANLLNALVKKARAERETAHPADWGGGASWTYHF